VRELRIERGDPTSEDLAALVVALVGRARAAAAQPDRSGPAARWRASGLPGAALRPGPNAWRASALPVR
jgi:hypothetical protein